MIEVTGLQVLAKRLKAVVKTFGRTDQPRAGGCMAEAGGGGAGPNDDLRRLLLRPDVADWKDGSRPHPRRIQHRLPAGFERGPVRDRRAIYDRLHYEVSSPEAGPTVTGAMCGPSSSVSGTSSAASTPPSTGSRTITVRVLLEEARRAGVQQAIEDIVRLHRGEARAG